MDESALHRRLDAIERRQYLILGLLVVPYLIGVASFLLRGFDAGTLVLAGVGVVVACFLALVYAGYRARQPSRR
jgi:heme A synthase